MNRRTFIATAALAPVLAPLSLRRLRYEAPTLTRLPFTLPKATGPFIPKPRLP